VTAGPSAPVTVRVATASPYDVVIGHGLTDRLIAAVSGATGAMILHPAGIAERANALAAAIRDSGVTVRRARKPLRCFRSAGRPVPQPASTGPAW